MNRPVETALKQRFAQWALTYGGEQYRRLGYSSLDRIGEAAANDDAASAATINPATAEAHEIERIVQAMEKSGRWKEARVLRAEYFMASLPEPMRIGCLRRKGLVVSRTSYYTYLDAARAFVAGALAKHR